MKGAFTVELKGFFVVVLIVGEAETTGGFVVGLVVGLVVAAVETTGSFVVGLVVGFGTTAAFGRETSLTF
jgi:flagellar biosynthesis protein FliR